jgi:hypothetical protein
MKDGFPRAISGPSGHPQVADLAALTYPSGNAFMSAPMSAPPAPGTVLPGAGLPRPSVGLLEVRFWRCTRMPGADGEPSP